MAYASAPWRMRPDGIGPTNPTMTYADGGAYGLAPWMMGRGWMGPVSMYGTGPGGGAWSGLDLDLTVDQVKSNMEQWLRAAGNSHLKIGTVTQRDIDTVTVDILTIDKDGLVQRYEINRHTGLTQPVGG